MYPDVNDDTLHRYKATVAARKRATTEQPPLPRRSVWTTIRSWVTARLLYVERTAPRRRR